jgi:DNA mismatch repair protein MSH5
MAVLTEGGSIEHSVTRSADWDYTPSKLRVVEHLFVRGLMENDGKKAQGGSAAVVYDNYQLLASELDFSDRPQVCALGGLVAYLQKNVFTMEQHGHVYIGSLAPVESLLQGHCVIDPISLRALSIFVEDFHPSQVKGKGRSKEGFSVFGVFDRTSSSGGRRCLREWFRSPLADLRRISERQDGVGLFMVQEFKEIESSIAQLLKKVTDTPQVLLRIKKVQSSYRDWTSLCGTFEAAWSILDHLRILHTRTTGPPKSWLAELLGRCDAAVLHKCYRLIADSIDVDLSKHSKQTCIREGYSQELDDLRAKWDNVEGILEAAAKRTLDDLPNLATIRAEFIAHIGYHIVVSSEDQQHLGPDSGLDFMFAQDGMLFMKNDLMRRYDNEVGDVPSQYHDLVKSVLREIEEELLAHEVDLNSLSTAIFEVDATISLARVAVEYDFVRPKMVESPVVLIKNGRHPLQQLVVDTFIPNDVALGPGGKAAAIVTGPNFSGKSVYLKMVGVLVFLAHVGSFLPCDDAIVGVCDRIFTRIESVETCTVPQSTFTIDLNQMATMLRRCTSKSLLLIDEFGKGTSPADGMALLAAIVGALTAELNPRMVVTTHFLELFEYNLFGHDADARLSKFRMDYILPDEASGLGLAPTDADADAREGAPHHDELVPLFKLVCGVATSSDGLACAKLGGLPEPLLHRAREVMDLLQAGKPITPAPALQGAGGALALGPGSAGHDLLTLFLDTFSFADADEALLAQFKDLVLAL